MSFLRASALIARQAAPLARVSQRAPFSSVCKMVVVGFVGRDPEIKTFGENKSVTSFSVATNEFFEGQKQTMWHNIQINSPWTSEFVMNNVRKGDKVYVDGSFKIKSYANKEGVEVKTHVIKAFEVQKLSSKNVAATEDEHVDEYAESSNLNNSQYEYSNPPAAAEQISSRYAPRKKSQYSKY